ncbi:hypothetical protein Tco_0997836 [Tanacetum coccineum]
MDRKSTSGACQTLRSKLVCWSAKKQQSVAMSFAEADAVAISNNPVLHSRTKHTDIRYHFMMDHILKGDIELHFILTEYQLADIFTKPLDEPTFKRMKCPSLQKHLQILEKLLFGCGFFQNTINSISKLPWCTVVVEDPNPPTDEFEVCPLKEFLIKINVKNGQKPLTLDYKTVCETTRLDYNNGLYVDHPYTEVLGGNYSSTEQLNSIQQLLVFSLFTRTKIDIGKIIYSDHITRIMAKSRKKKNKSQTVTQPKPKSQGPEASGALPVKRKNSKTQTTSLVQATVTPPSEKVPTKDSDRTQSVSSG